MNEAVERELEELRAWVTSLAHPSDRTKAWHVFVRLDIEGQRAHHDEIRRKALDLGFDETDADDLAHMPDDIRTLRRAFGDLAGGRGKLTLLPSPDDQ